MNEAVSVLLVMIPPLVFLSLISGWNVILTPARTHINISMSVRRQDISLDLESKRGGGKTDPCRLPS